MTRFARAKGSKASNERREEEATPWHVMRQQLAEQLNNFQRQSNNNSSYNLKEILSKKNDSKMEEIWSDFGETKVDRCHKLNPKTEKTDKKSIKNQQIKTLKNIKPILASTDGRPTDISINSINNPSNKSKKDSVVDVRKSSHIDYKLEKSNESSKRKAEEVDVEFKVTSKKKKHKSDNNNGNTSGNLGVRKLKKNEKLHVTNVFVETPTKSQDDVKTKSSNKSSVDSEPGFQKNKIKKKKAGKSYEIGLNDFSNANEDTTNSTTNETNSSKEEIKSRERVIASNNSSSRTRAYNNYENYNMSNRHYRKNHFETIIANGREIQIVPYHGFYVKKDDAEELKKLRKKLLAQKIPKEKLENIMKLERRKAEKALTREKKKVCYHCRQFGHNFSDCPEIKDSDMVKTGVCFKCGSLEHSHFECKVHMNQEFRHAVCFVCKEQGHIARQCPLNSQGLYPKGGSCHLCGEITHLRKDCPKAVEEKTSKGVTVDTLASGTVEDIKDQLLHQKQVDVKKKKVIKFQ